jgi:hypothetical protein
MMMNSANGAAEMVRVPVSTALARLTVPTVTS